jgi:hypothetical protein
MALWIGSRGCRHDVLELEGGPGADDDARPTGKTSIGILDPRPIIPEIETIGRADSDAPAGGVAALNIDSR